MLEILPVRLAGAIGILSLAVFTAGLVSVPSFPTTGASLSPAQPTVLVNRTNKGDRLPVLGPVARQPEFGSPAGASPAAPGRGQPAARIPLGCDPAFSSISSPSLAGVFRRCIA